MNPIVRLEGVTKDYKTLRAVDDISVEIGRGITGLLGPNGAGKSTLIKLLLGLVHLSAGAGQVLGIDLAANPRRIRERVGYLPEDDCYIPGLSGIESVQFMARLSGRPETEGLRRSHEILDYCGIGQERYRAVETYSTGMRQQLKFAQAIVHDPELLILDEPTSGLDPDERQAMLGRIRDLAESSGKTVLISTHILPDVQAVCDTVVIMVAGRVCLVERLDVLQRPTDPTHHLVVHGDRQPLVSRIVSEGYRIDANGTQRMTVHGMEPAVVEQVWRWAAETGVALRSLRPASNSLEDVFLDAIRREDVADQ